MSRDLLTTREVAKALGVGTTSIKRWADSGLLRCVKTPGGHRRFPRDAVETFMQGLQSHGVAPDVLSADRTEAWLASLTGGLPTTALVKALQAEHREHGSWFSVADTLSPVIDYIGKAWARGEISVIEEHIASERLARALGRCSESIEVSEEAPVAFLMAAEGDDHTLGLGLVELCLREAGWSTTWAGRKTPINFACEFLANGQVGLVAVSASEYSRDTRSLADQAGRLGSACQALGIPLLLGGKGLWPEQPVYGYRILTFAELRSVLHMMSRQIPKHA